MTEKPLLKISVRELVSFVLSSGDLHPRRFGPMTSALEGILGHQRLQKARPKGYQAEVPLRFLDETEHFQLQISGRVDGIYVKKDPVIIEEIKTTKMELDQIPSSSFKLHMGQAKVYAFIYASQEKISPVIARVTYLNLEENITKSHDETLSLDDLQQFYKELSELWLNWMEKVYQWRQTRDESLLKLAFPFEQYREGQRHFAATVYRANRDGKKLLVQAPTGIGKTTGTLFPSLKAMGEQHLDRIFFLTAKTPGRTVAEHSLKAMRERGLKAKAVTLTARDKICFNAPCDPKTCEYALGYYDRLPTALEDAYESDDFDRQKITDFAQKHKVCPFEFSLDLAIWSDLVICDFNYAFDPSVFLRRFFTEDQGDYILLVDEAHNLIDRARDMYSASLSRNEIGQAHKEVKDRDKKTGRALGGIYRLLGNQRKELDEREERVSYDLPEKLIGKLHGFCKAADTWLGEESEVGEQFREVYFSIRAFLRAAEFFDKTYAVIQRQEYRDFSIKLYCQDPGPRLQQFIEKSKASTFFSATLTPFPYYNKLLGGADHSLHLPSPFPQQHLCLTVANYVSTKYKDREASYQQVVSLIGTVLSAKKGNYFIFFPSYQYMNEVAKRFCEAYPRVEVVRQRTGMTEEERTEFLELFSEDNTGTLAAFAVMGGIFGEGIDLPGRKLIGVVVVGVGLPGLCTERDLIKTYFNQKGLPGFAYAYQLPGMSRVLQTAGRVIRTEEDRGVVCLIDERFQQPRYQQLFPEHWQAQWVNSPKELEQQLTDFWKTKPK